MLAANVDAAKQVVTSNGNAHNPPPPPSQPEAQNEIQLVEHVAPGQEEEEGETDPDAEFDDEIESEFEDTAEYDTQGYVESDRRGTNEAIRYRSQTPEPPTYRKRSHDEASEEPEPGPRTPPAREGTPPKRARLEDRPDDKSVASVLDAPPIRQRKRSSEEAEADAPISGRQSPKRVKA